MGADAIPNREELMIREDMVKSITLVLRGTIIREKPLHLESGRGRKYCPYYVEDMLT